MPTTERQIRNREKAVIPVQAADLREALTTHIGLREHHDRVAQGYLAQLQKVLARAYELNMNTQEIWGRKP